MITILKPGLLDTLQDLGRHGYQKYGVVTSGAMDAWGHRIANLLVGNKESESTVEMTLIGPEIRFAEDSLIALCGGDFQPTIDGTSIPMWRPIFIEKNCILKIGQARKGCRAYLAVGGGFDLPMTMNSQSTYIRAGIGGFKGRALKKNDELAYSRKSKLTKQILKTLTENKTNGSFQAAKWSVSSKLIPQLSSNQEIRITRGNQFDLFNKSYTAHFLNQSFTVSSKSDRMGYRLNSPLPPPLIAEELISEAVAFGSIQVPPDGKPIILAADRQTTGGYPKIAQISACDFSLIAQAKPGDSLSFIEISLAQSQALYLKREQNLQQLKTSISLKFDRR